MPPIDPVEKDKQVSGTPRQKPSDESTSKPAEDTTGSSGSEGSGAKEDTPHASVPAGTKLPPDHKFDEQKAALLEPNVPDIKPAPIPENLADSKPVAQVKKLSDHDLEFIVNKYSVRRGVRIDHDHAGERAYDDAIVFETPLKDRFNEDHLESGVTTRSYSTGREADMACQGFSSLKGGVKAKMAEFDASMSNSEGYANAQKTTETYTVSSHSYYRARLSFNPLSGHARLTPQCGKAFLDVCSMHRAAGAKITETRKALQKVHDNFGAVLPRMVLFGGLLTITSSSNTTSQSLNDAAEKKSAAAANAVVDKKSGVEFDASAQNAAAKTGTGKYVVGDVSYSVRSLGGDPIKTTNVWAWTHTVSAPEHWAVVQVDDFIALHEMLSSENSLTIQEIMKAEPPVKKPLKGKWVDTMVVASSRSSGTALSFKAFAVEPKHLEDGWCFVGQQYSNHQALLLKVTDEAVDRKLRRITHFTTMWNNRENPNDSPKALSEFKLEIAELHTDGYEALSSQFIAPQDVWHSARKMAEFNLEPYAHYIKPIDVYAVPREYLIQATLLNDVNGAIWTDVGTDASAQCSVWPVVAEQATKDDVVDMHFFKAVKGRLAANNRDKVYMLKKSCIEFDESA